MGQIHRVEHIDRSSNVKRSLSSHLFSSPNAWFLLISFDRKEAFSTTFILRFVTCIIALSALRVTILVEGLLIELLARFKMSLHSLSLQLQLQHSVHRNQIKSLFSQNKWARKEKHCHYQNYWRIQAFVVMPIERKEILRLPLQHFVRLYVGILRPHPLNRHGIQVSSKIGVSQHTVKVALVWWDLPRIRDIYSTRPKVIPRVKVCTNLVARKATWVRIVGYLIWTQSSLCYDKMYFSSHRRDLLGRRMHISITIDCNDVTANFTEPRWDEISK